MDLQLSVEYIINAQFHVYFSRHNQSLWFPSDSITAAGAPPQLPAPFSPQLLPCVLQISLFSAPLVDLRLRNSFAAPLIPPFQLPPIVCPRPLSMPPVVTPCTFPLLLPLIRCCYPFPSCCSPPPVPALSFSHLNSPRVPLIPSFCLLNFLII